MQLFSIATLFIENLNLFGGIEASRQTGHFDKQAEHFEQTACEQSPTVPQSVSVLS